jgi:hypothetical protein
MIEIALGQIVFLRIVVGQARTLFHSFQHLTLDDTVALFVAAKEPLNMTKHMDIRVGRTHVSPVIYCNFRSSGNTQPRSDIGNDLTVSEQKVTCILTLTSVSRFCGNSFSGLPSLA